MFRGVVYHYVLDGIAVSRSTTQCKSTVDMYTCKPFIYVFQLKSTGDIQTL